MTKVEHKRLIGIWGAITRNRDNRCILCGSQYLFQSHHIFFLSQGDWTKMYNPLNGAGLCNDCHDLAHGLEQKDTFDRIIREIWQDEGVVRDLYFRGFTGEQRGQILQGWHNSPQSPQIITPEYKTIRKQLLKVLEDVNKFAWMDDY